MKISLIITLSSLFLFSCNHEGHEIEIQDEIQHNREKEEETVSSKFYKRKVEGNTLLLGPEEVETEPNELKFVFKSNETTDWNNSELELAGVEYIRDFGGARYKLNLNQEYSIRNGTLRTFFGQNELLFDYNLLVSEDENFEFEQEVYVKLKKGHYSKGENFISFVTIDTIYSDTKTDLSIFVDTDVEIDFEHTSDSTYRGKLIYKRDEFGGNSSKWYSNNFKFELINL